jgi:TonB family protein
VIAKGGSASRSEDQARVLGQVGSDAGSGIEGGTGGSPNGVVGGIGLSTRYKGTGTTTGTGIGGSSTGKLFVDLDATATGDSQITEGLSKTEVGRVIHEHSAEIRQCYEAALIKNPAIRGRMSVNFSIAASGKVQSAKVQDSTFDSTFMGSCLIRKMQGWMFPKPKNGVSVEVTYPFNFRTLGGS